MLNIYGKRIGIEVKQVLEKVRENKVQSSLTEKERIENVKNVYSAKSKIDIYEKNIILVDDIFTTGSTVRNCSKILKESGAKNVCVFAIAKS